MTTQLCTTSARLGFMTTMGEGTHFFGLKGSSEVRDEHKLNDKSCKCNVFRGSC